MARKRGGQIELFASSQARLAGRRARRTAGGTAAAVGKSERTEKAEKTGAFLPHVARPAHEARHPVHVTMRRVATGPSFRAQRVCAAIRAVINGAKRNGVRVLHYSVQHNHLHLMIEGKDSADLSKQMRTLFSRIAFAVNAVARRHGKLFRERHHRHALKTPREVRNALVYILFNDRKHGAATPETSTATTTIEATNASAKNGRGARQVALDRCSSAWWFRDWHPEDRPPPEVFLDESEPPTTKPRTWLARYGWHRGDEALLLRFSESPRFQLGGSR